MCKFCGENIENFRHQFASMNKQTLMSANLVEKMLKIVNGKQHLIEKAQQSTQNNVGLN